MRKQRRFKNKRSAFRFVVDRIADKIIDEVLAEEARAKADRAKGE